MEAKLPTTYANSAKRNFDDAASVVRVERRAASKSLILRCQKVEVIGDPADGIFALDITRFTRMDWTWEGARAFSEDSHDPGLAPLALWSGEVVGIDEIASKLYVFDDAGTGPPTIGEFVVQPYDFLEALDALYNGDYAGQFAPHLAAALEKIAGTGPVNRVPIPVSLRALVGVWDHSLGYVWGPPGTGKTFSLGAQVAEALEMPEERILIVSTTNKATDGAALSVARALDVRGIRPTQELLRRVGSGADVKLFRAECYEHLLDDDTGELREQLSELVRLYRRATAPERRAQIWKQIKAVRLALSSGARQLWEVDSRVVVTTSFLGMRHLASEGAAQLLATGNPPFTTIIADEAGLLSRVSVAALSLWATKRMILFGDPKQLSPISKISRVQEPRRARWIAQSGLEHLRTGHEPGVRLLAKQYRMHPEVRAAVSDFMYQGLLTDAEEVRSQRHSFNDPVLDQGKRAIWYVLDEDTDALPQIRADRGPGGRSWVRRRSRDVVERLFRAHPALKNMHGMFVSPFVAQARDIARLLIESGAEQWTSSTTHAQQGSEADVVIFDTVHAGSTAWSHGEWQRLINVGMSRAKHLLIVLASRLEMHEPFLRPLLRSLKPQVIRGVGGQLRWHEVSVQATSPPPLPTESDPYTLGAQIESRKSMRPILGAEQQRLCALPIDGKPRLVRGVAGSGKTAVLAHWLARRVTEGVADGPYWVVYANQALKGLIQSQVEEVWKSLGQQHNFPWDSVEVFHVLEIIERLEKELGLIHRRSENSYDFEARASRILATDVQPRCQAMFVDEAQDCGNATLGLLARLVAPRDADQPGQRAINIFYDNAQNVYRRSTPRWVDLGLDMVGRSTVMKESYRSTLPATEFALNVLYRLENPDGDPDHAELLARDLLHEEQRNGRRWWRVRFNEVDGPQPDFRQYTDRETELAALCHRMLSWIRDEGVRPGDIRVLANGSSIRRQIVQALSPVLATIGARVEERTSSHMVSDNDQVLVTTAHSFKGYDSEIVAVPAADKFVATVEGEKGALSHPLYVAMTRARSVLYVSSITRSPGSPSAAIVDALQTCLEDQRSVPLASPACTLAEEYLEIVERIGNEFRSWFQSIASTSVQCGPILRADGSVAAEPVFHFKRGGKWMACFSSPLTQFATQELLDLGVTPIRPGEDLQ